MRSLTHVITRYLQATHKPKYVEITSIVPKHTHTHNRFTAGLEYVRVHPGQQVPER